MNAVEIEEAVSLLAEQQFDRENFPFLFLEAFGEKPTTIKRLRSDKAGSTNVSDLKEIGGVLQRNNIHILTCAPGETSETLRQLRESPSTAKGKVQFILSTDGDHFEAEELSSGESVACKFSDFPNHFGFFLPLAGISTVKQIRDSSFDIRATSRLNKLYVELLHTNPEWGTAERRHDMNHFMARLIFCFFAEDTEIFVDSDMFTDTIAQMSERDSSNTHEVISEIFRSMNTKQADRDSAKIARWAKPFPYVNGGLFSGSTDVPRFSKIARTYLLHVGSLDWTQINPDIFGSMIQAVTDEEERGSLGMHYTSVPNILKVLNPLFLDDLREQLEQAGDNARKLLNLRKRISTIRIFDPACGSGNFLVIAYKEMRSIEAEINVRRQEKDRPSDIPLTNFRGIELRDFSAEIARLALIIAEYQCDQQYRGQKLALAEFLPLQNDNWITCGNALRLDWLAICPPTGKAVSIVAEDLFDTTIDQPEIGFENEGGETYICGNPPYLGSTWQSKEQKADLERIFKAYTKSWKSLDYVAGWFMKAAEYGCHAKASAAFVSTNSVCQGQQAPILWPLIFKKGFFIAFAHTSFKWANLASHNAGVTVAIIAISNTNCANRILYSLDINQTTQSQVVKNINAYLVPSTNIEVFKSGQSSVGLSEMLRGNMPYDGGHLLLTRDERDQLNLSDQQQKRFIRRIFGSSEFIKGAERYCLWIENANLKDALAIRAVSDRVEKTKAMRLGSSDKGANKMAAFSHQMREMNIGSERTIVIPCVSSEKREYLPAGIIDSNATITNLCFGLFDAPIWNLAILVSKLHLQWIATVCGKMKTDFRYSNTLGWNTFPLPNLTEKNKADLTRCAEDILLAREEHFPATIADLYDPEKMPENLRLAHERNDEVLERIYIGRRFKNDTERLEKLFDLYTKMTQSEKSSTASRTK